MRKSEEAVAWVVYKMAVAKKPDGINAVCDQAEWDAMEEANPGQHTLIRAGITNEAEAELLARGTSGGLPSTPCLGACEWKRRDEERPALGR